jgi:transposase-like protein
MRKHYTAHQKSEIVLEMFKEEQTIAQISSAHGIHATQLYKWKTQAVEGLPKLFDDERKTEKALQAAHEQETSELYAQIGKLTTQLAWLKKKSGLEPNER